MPEKDQDLPSDGHPHTGQWAEAAAPEWRGNRRVADGMRVAITAEATWCVLPRDGRAAITACPLCGTAIRDKAVAQRLADRVYPVRGPAMGLRQQ